MNTSTATPFSIPQGTPAAGRAVLQLLQRLQHGSLTLQLPNGTMQRFEFCFELAWKSLKLALSEWEGLGSASPRQAFEHAYALRWLEHEKPWLQMLQDRNLSSHTYREGLAREIHARIPQHASQLRGLLSALLQRAG